MSVALVGSSSGTSTSSGTTSFTHSLSQATTLGDCLIIWVTGSAGNVTACTANPGGNVMTHVTDVLVQAGQRYHLYALTNCPAGCTSIAVTCTNNSYVSIAAEFSGVLQSNAVDDNTSASGNAYVTTTSVWASNSVTCTQYDLVLIFLGFNTSTSLTYTTTPGSVLRTQSNAFTTFTFCAIWNAQSTSGVFSGTIIGGSPPNNGSVLGASLKSDIPPFVPLPPMPNSADDQWLGGDTY